MYEVTIKQAIKSWNDKNPTLRKKTLSSLAEEIGTTPQYLSQLGKRNYKQLNIHFNVIYDSYDEEKIREMWDIYIHIGGGYIVFNRLESIRQILDCEIYDLIKKIKKS